MSVFLLEKCQLLAFMPLKDSNHRPPFYFQLFLSSTKRKKKQQQQQNPMSCN